jgi:hypothetical protein
MGFGWTAHARTGTAAGREPAATYHVVYARQASPRRRPDADPRARARVRRVGTAVGAGAPQPVRCGHRPPIRFGKVESTETLRDAREPVPSDARPGGGLTPEVYTEGEALVCTSCRRLEPAVQALVGGSRRDATGRKRKEQTGLIARYRPTSLPSHPLPAGRPLRSTHI